jgi:hypothetical protein
MYAGRCAIQFLYCLPSAIHEYNFKEKTLGSDTVDKLLLDEYLFGDKDISSSVT